MEEENWNRFEEACRQCRQCPLCETRTQVVVGRGGFHRVPVMIVGEGPGEQEDLQGKAFVGKAGRLLDLLLESHRFEPADWYIANIVKCRPPGNREPSDAEAAACLPWLRWQVKAIRPSILVCLGRVAARHLIDKDIRITAARGQWVERQGFLMMPTWHPAAVLRDPAKKTDLWLDVEKVRLKLDELRRETKNP
jgi:uracil-DNA glycosylase